MSFMVGVKTQDSGTTWTWNQMRFETKKEAEKYADQLHARWTSVQGWTIKESTDPVNAKFPHDGD